MSNISSPPLRLELRASRWLAGALIVLTGLAALSVLDSGLPAITLAVLPPLLVLAHRALRRHVGMSLLFRADGSAAQLHEADVESPLTPLQFIERGPLAVLVLQQHDGKRHRIPFAPDTLDAATRRLLRLWFSRHITRAVTTREPAHV